MKKTKRTLISVLNAEGFNKNYATLGNVRTTITDGDTFIEHLIESTDDWVETDSNGCISALEVFREPRPYTAEFVVKNKKVEDLPNHDIIHIIKENLKEDYGKDYGIEVSSLLDEFVSRYSEEQKKFYELKSKHYKCYTEEDLLMAMQFAVNDITGRKLRTTVLETMVDDFINEKEK